MHSHTCYPLPSLFYSIHIAFCTRTPSKPNWPLFVFAQAHPAPPPVVLYTYVLAFVSCQQVFSSTFSPYGILSIVLPCFCFSVPLPPCVTQIKSQQTRFGGVAVLETRVKVRKLNGALTFDGRCCQGEPCVCVCTCVCVRISVAHWRQKCVLTCDFDFFSFCLCAFLSCSPRSFHFSPLYP